jgi:hypothetical protein
MKTKPRSLQNLTKKQEKKENEEIISDIRDKLNNSFCSVNTDILSSNDPIHEYKDNRKNLLSYIHIFKEHVLDPDHPINVCSKYFILVFCDYLNLKIQEIRYLKNMDNEDSHKICNLITENLIKDIQKFIIKLQTSLRLMYSQTISYSSFMEEKDEMINLIVNLIFREDSLYDLLYNLFEISISQEVEIFKHKISEMKKIKPQDLGIPNKFCLNEVTVKYQKQLVEENNLKIKLDEMRGSRK